MIREVYWWGIQITAENNPEKHLLKQLYELLKKDSTKHFEHEELSFSDGKLIISGCG